MKIQWFTKRTQGSISIMLCVLMLPMVLFSSLVVDASRLHSVKTTISGAGDLALNAQLSEYEQVLYDMYGLFASVQSTNELQAALKDYFKQTIEKSVTDEEESKIDAIADQLVDFVFQTGASGATDFDNLISLECVDFSTEGVPSSALSNPAVLKRQIIETMKYRGPVSVVSTILSKLNIFKNSSKQAEVVEKKMDYLTSLDGLTEACLEAYYEIQRRPQYDEKGNLKSKEYDEPGYNLAAEKFNTFRNGDDKEGEQLEKTFIERIPECLTWAITAVQVKKELEEGEKGNSIEYGKLQDLDREIAEIEIPKPDMNELANQFDTAVQTTIPQEVVDAINEYRDKFAEVYDEMLRIVSMDSYVERGLLERVLGGDWDTIGEDVVFSGNPAGGYYVSADGKNINFEDIRVFISEASIIEGYLPHAGSWTNNLANWEYCESYMEDLMNYQQVAFGGWKEKINLLFEKYQEGYNTLSSLYNKYDASYSTMIDEFPIDNEDLEKVETQYQNVSEQWELVKKTYNALHDVTETVASFYTCATDYSKVQKIRDACFTVPSNRVFIRYRASLLDSYNRAISAENRLQDILNLLDEIEARKKEWGDSLNGVDDGAIKSSMKSDYSTTTEAYDKKEIENLKKNIENKRRKVARYLELVEKSATFCERKLGEFKDVPDGEILHEMSLYKLQTVPKNLSSYKQAAKKFAYIEYECDKNLTGLSDSKLSEGAKYKKKNKDLVDLGYVDGYKDSEDYKKLSTKLEDEEKFWFILKEIGEGEREEQDLNEDQQKQKDNINEAVENNKSDEIGKVEEDKKETKEQRNKAKEEVGDIYDRIKTTNAKVKEQNEDDGSTDAVNDSNGNTVPGKQKSYKDQGNKSKKSVSAGKGFLATLANIGKTVGEYTFEEEYFTELFSCDYDAVITKKNGSTKTDLFGNSLKRGAEGLYGREIEYILWGDSNLDSNVSSTYTRIFLIRLVINTIYAFTAADIQSFALEVATAIAGWTVFGVPIVQAIITIALALAESGVDVGKLKNGEDVVILKSTTTFVCSPTGLVTNGVKKLATEAAKQITDYAVGKLGQFMSTLEGTIGKNIDKLSSYVDSYVETQIKGIKDQVKSLIEQPLVESLNSLSLRMQAGIEASEAELDQAIDNGIERVKESIDELPDSMTKELAGNAFEYLKTSIVGELKNSIKTKVAELGKKPQNVISELIKVIDAKIDKVMGGIESTIKSKKNELVSTAKKELNELADKPVEYFESFMNEKMGERADKVSGSVTEHLSSWIGDSVGNAVSSAIDSTSGGLGITMNYREYCKLFVFVELALGHESGMLQRTAALIEMNVKHGQGKNSSKNTTFDITKAYTLLFAKGTVKVKTIFPWGTVVNMDETGGAGDETKTVVSDYAADAEPQGTSTENEETEDKKTDNNDLYRWLSEENTPEVTIQYRAINGY